MDRAERGPVRVVFSRGRPGERMRADDLGGGEYRLDDVPVFTYGISYGDVFAAEERDGEVLFARVLRRGAHATYRLTTNERLAFDAAARELLERVTALAALRRTYGIDDVALSVPSGERARDVERLLGEGERRGFWDWECSCAPDDPIA